jgi:type VI protein secretion system component VasF
MLVASGMTEWNDDRIAVTEFNRRAGDNEFFDLLYDAEAEVGEDADGKLAFYYCCIGLGFTGMYEDEPKHLHEIMQRLEPRVRGFMDRDVISRITPEAYSNTLEMNVAPDTAPRYLGLLLLAIGTVFAITVSIFYLYIDAFSTLSKVLTKIISS